MYGDRRSPKDTPMTASPDVTSKALRKAVAGQVRAEFFARPGATVAQYRGTANVYVNRKHKANRNACRNFRAEY